MRPIAPRCRCSRASPQKHSPTTQPRAPDRNVCNLRELRGSVHLLALVATGVSPLVAHTIRRPDDVASFGWEAAPDISDDDRARLDVADVLTDRLLVPATEALTDAQRNAFVTAVDAIGAHLN